MPTALEQLAAAGVDDALFAAVMGRPDVDAWLDGQLAAGDPDRVRADCVYWLTHYGRTFDPRLPVPDQPMVPFPKQVEYLAWLDERIRVAKAGGNGDGLVDKCRDAGVTTFSCAKALHLWLWSPGTVIGFGSRKLELVDNKGDPNTIFEKIRYLLYRLPRWMLPRGFKPHEHDLEGKLLNPENGNAIVGEGGDNIGRGGRTTVTFVDESAFLTHPKLVERSLSQNTRCRIDISTHNGPGTVFYEKQQSGRVAVFTFDFWEDPRKNRKAIVDGKEVYPWLEAEKKRLDPVTLAQEVLRDATASLEGIAIPGVWVRAAVGFEIPGLAEQSDVWAGLDIGGGTLPTSFLAVRRGPKLLPLKGYTGPNTTAIAWQVRDDAQALGVQSLAFEHTGVGVSVKGTWESAEDAQKPAFDVRALNTGSPASREPWPDGKLASDKFLNVRAEAWWGLRERFRKTYEYSIGQETYAPEELISIPNDPDLIAQLSSPMAEQVASGKCVAPETRIYDPVRNEERAIWEWMCLGIGPYVWSLGREGRAVIARAGVPFVKCVAPMASVAVDGRTVRVTARHRLLTPSGWRHLEELRPGMLVCVPHAAWLPLTFSASPLPSDSTRRDEEPSPCSRLKSSRDARRSTARASVQSVWRQSGPWPGPYEESPDGGCCRERRRTFAPVLPHLGRRCGFAEPIPLAARGSFPANEAVGGRRHRSATQGCQGDYCRGCGRCDGRLLEGQEDGQSWLPLRDDAEAHSHPESRSDALAGKLECNRHDASSCPDFRASWSWIQEIRPAGFDLVMDLEVPVFHNYFAHGILHHNTKIESKKDMRSRGVKSPDRADAVVLSFYEGGRSVYETAGLLVF